MPYIKVWIHLVWSTKKRIPYLNSRGLRIKVWKHIKENALQKGIHLDCVNGYDDHVHCLMSLEATQSIADNVRLIKGESSYWINKEQLTTEKFKWQDDYFAVSVSESVVDKVRRYIHRQEIHHGKKTFEDEYQEFITKFGFQRFQDNS